MNTRATALGELRLSGAGAQVHARRKLLRTLAHCRALRATQAIGCCSLLSEVCGEALQCLPALRLWVELDGRCLCVEITPSGPQDWPDLVLPATLGAGRGIHRLHRLGHRYYRAQAARGGA